MVGAHLLVTGGRFEIIRGDLTALEDYMVKRSIAFVLLSSLATLLAACGGSSNDSPPATGEVAVILTDGPTDVYEQILVSITELTLIGPGGHVDLYNGPEITFDLLEMSEWGDLAFNTKVLAGQYNKIRLQLSGVTLVDLDLALSDPDREVDLDSLPAGGTIDLNPRGPFEVSPDYTTVIKLDMDANRSFQAVQTGNPDLIRLRPIFFVDVYEGEIFLPERLVRVYGTVTGASIDSLNSSFNLCGFELISQVSGPSVTDMNDCVEVSTDSATGIFDGASVGSFSSLDGDQRVTAIGFITDANDPEAILGLEAVSVGIGDRVPYGTGGGWDTVHGVVVEPVAPCAATCFDPTDSDPAITTVMSSSTRVFRADGVPLMQSDVTVDDVGSVDAYRANPPGELFASLIVLSTDADGGAVSGSLDSTSDPAVTAPYTQLFVVPEAGGQVIVCADADTNIVQVLADDEVVTLFDLIDPAVLEPGVLIEAYGEPMPSTSVTCDILAAQIIIEPAP
jgi:hypothetical protein